MASQKTVPTEVSAEEFIDAVPDERRREDARRLSALMSEWTGEQPVMWGPTIVGFGSHRYRYDSGREGEAPLAAFSPRKPNLVVYLADGWQERYAKLKEKLGPHKGGKSCLYLKRLDDVDLKVLRELVDRSVRVGQGADRRASK